MTPASTAVGRPPSGAEAAGAAGCEGALPAAPSTSALTMRPPGPEPWSAPRSTPCASARRRASGLALTRAPSAFGWAAGAGARSWRGRRGRGGRRRLRLRRFGLGGGGRGLRFRLRGRAGRGGNVLALAGHHRDHLADLHPVGAVGNHDLRDRAFVDRLEFHRRLVRLDLGEDVAGFDRIAFLHQPFGERPFLHRRGERRHPEFDRHGSELSFRERPRPSKQQSHGNGQGPAEAARLREGTIWRNRSPRGA